MLNKALKAKDNAYQLYTQSQAGKVKTTKGKERVLKKYEQL